MELKNISKIYKNKNNKIQALNNINLKINHLGMIFILGASGCGKTTLLNIISQKDNHYDGELIVDGKVERIEQEIMLFESLTVLDNLLLVTSHKDKIIELVSEVGLLNQLNQKVNRLSIGQKKRVQIVRSLLVDFDYLVCDEPTASLDEENTQIIMEILKKISNKKSVIIVTHEVGLCDLYADRVISMGKGIIESDQCIHSTKEISQVNNTVSKTKKLFPRKLYIHEMKSQKLFYSMKGFIFIVLSVLILVILSLFSSVNQKMIIQEKWLNSRNLIVTQSKSKEDEPADLYDKTSIQMVKDNVNDVIAYKYGWSASHISLDVFTPEMNIDDLKNAIMLSEQMYKENWTPLPSEYEKWKNELNKILQEEIRDGEPISKDVMVYRNYSYYDCFSHNKDGYLIPILEQEFIKMGNYNQNVSLYQMFDKRTLELKSGKMMTANNEVIIDSRLANQLCKQYSLNSIDDLINKEYNIQFVTTDYGLPVKISGITYEESNLENRVFFKEDALDQYIESAFKMNTKYPIHYLFINFLTYGNEDENSISKTINEVLNSQKSEFVSYSDSILSTNSTKIQNYSYSFYIGMISAMIIIVVIYMLMLIYYRKRMLKECRILKYYHYSIGSYILLPILFLFLFVIGIQFFVYSFLCQYINNYAQIQGYPPLISNNILYCFISVILAIILVLMVEGGYYVSQVRKHL